MAYASPLTLADLALLVRDESDDDRRWRLLLGFLEEYRHGGALDRPTLFAAEPRETNDRRWDVLLAAVAEHLAYDEDVPAPLWVRTPEREWLGTIWWVVPLPSARPWALAHSPASFRRRGIFLHPDDLAVA